MMVKAKTETASAIETFQVGDLIRISKDPKHRGTLGVVVTPGDHTTSIALKNSVILTYSNEGLELIEGRIQPGDRVFDETELAYGIIKSVFSVTCSVIWEEPGNRSSLVFRGDLRRTLKPTEIENYNNSTFNEGDRIKIIATQSHQSTQWIGRYGKVEKATKNRVHVRLERCGFAGYESFTLPLPHDHVERVTDNSGDLKVNVEAEPVPQSSPQPPHTPHPTPHTPLTPHILTLADRTHYYRAPDLIRWQVDSETPCKLRVTLAPDQNIEIQNSKLKTQNSKPITLWQHKCYCLPTEQEWQQAQHLQIKFQIALNDLANYLLVDLGSYTSNLTAAGGYKTAPNPLTPTVISYQDPADDRGSYLFNLPLQVYPTQFYRYEAIAHTPKMLRYRHTFDGKGYESITSQANLFPCPHDTAWEEFLDLRQQACNASEALQNYLKQLGTYQEAKNDGRYQQTSDCYFQSASSDTPYPGADVPTDGTSPTLPNQQPARRNGRAAESGTDQRLLLDSGKVESRGQRAEGNPTPHTREQLLAEIEAIHKSGPVAPTGAEWNRYQVKKMGGKGERKQIVTFPPDGGYYYTVKHKDAIFQRADGKLVKSIQIGTQSSAAYRDWQQRFERRRRIRKLKQELEKLD